MKRLLILLLALSCVLAGCAEEKETEPAQTAAPSVPATEATTEPTTEATTEPATEPTEPPTEPDPVEELLASMTLEEKVGQLFLGRCPMENAAEDVARYHLGGYILFARDFNDKTAQQIREDIGSYQAAAKIPLLIGVDEEGGTVVRVSSNEQLRPERFRSPQKIYAEGGMEGIIADAEEKDMLLYSLGINLNFAPVADVSVSPDDFIYDRTFGQDGSATAEYTKQVVAQMAKDQIGSVLKHFPGYGDNVDTHTGIAVDDRPLEAFLEEDLLPFYSYTAGEGQTAIMVSHNIVNCMDDKMPASLSPEVHRFMREEFGFDGVIMTDGLDMGAVNTYAESGDIALTALLAGNDMLLICDYTTGIPAILKAVEDGVVTETMVEEACRRVLTWKQALGLI